MSFENELRSDPVALAKRYSFFPPNKAAGFNLSTDVNAKALEGDFAGFTRSQVKKDKKIARVTLKLGLSSRGECLLVEPTLGGDTGVPVYYLPWDDKGAAVRMTIPEEDTARPEDQHPKIFFTAVLSGCSIIFKGSAQCPTIYHCGTAGGEVGTPTSTKFGNSNDFFSQMLSGHGYRLIGGQINSTDYMIPRSAKGADAVAESERQFLEALKQQPQFQRGFVLKAVVSWGSCFGVRKGGDWEFYLQQNGTLTYDTYKWEFVNRDKEVKKKTLFGSKTVTQTYTTTGKVVTPGKPISLPILVKKVFPGTGTASMTSDLNLLQL